MTDLEILEQLIDDLPPEAWKMVPAHTQKLVMERIMQSPKYTGQGDNYAR